MKLLIALLIPLLANAKVTTLETRTQVLAELDKSGPVVLLYTATWCGPCKAFHPTYEKLSDDMTNIRFYQLVDDGEHAMLQLNGHQDVFKAFPSAYAGKDEYDLRFKHCPILEGDRDYASVKKAILNCLKEK